MITDALTRLEDGTTMTTFSTHALSTAWLDLGTVVEDLGAGTDLFANITVTVAPAATDVGGVEFQLILLPVTTLAAMSVTVTFTDAGEVVNWASHGLAVATPVVFTNSGGALPTGLTANRTYFVTAPAAGTFTLSSTAALAHLGTPDVTFTTGSGTHTGHVVPYVIGSSGHIPAQYLSVGSIITVRSNPMPRLLGTPGLYVPPSYRYVFARYVESSTPTTGTPSSAVTAGKWTVDLCQGSAEQVRYYASGIPNLV